VKELIERLCALSDPEGRWSISSKEVAELLAVEPVRFWRTVHQVQDRISFSEAIDGWTQDTVGDLVTVLESLLGPEAEGQMIRAGLFLPYALGVELLDEITFHARRLGAAHDPRLDELSAMLRHTGNVRAAIRIYLDEHVDLDELFRTGVESFLAFHELPSRARSTARRFLQKMIERHVLDRAGLLVGLVERLLLAAARLGYVDPELQPAAGGARAGGRDGRREGRTAEPAGRIDRRTWARRVMGVDGRSYSAADLRPLYRKLMMRHHPDVDPSGLEKCKDVNAAYAMLISDFTDSG
jgi:hypothetical protein